MCNFLLVIDRPALYRDWLKTKYLSTVLKPLSTNSPSSPDAIEDLKFEQNGAADTERERW
jgi:hypothetical protein